MTEGKQIRVLVVVAHPDDAEFMCGGTLARWSREGFKISYCLCTDGNHGSSDPEMTAERLAALRREEQLAAARVFGTDDVTFLGYYDAQLEPTIELRRAITRVIRRVRPHIVVCQDPTTFYLNDYINHPDHRAAGEAALGAVMPSADTRLIFPELLEEGLEPWKPSHIYLAGTTNPNIWLALEPDDIERKIESLRAHVTQLDMERVEPMIRERSQMMGQEAREHGIETTYAERFRLVRLRNLEEMLLAEVGDDDPA